MDALGVTAEEIDIRPAARQMLTDMGHPFARGRAGLRRHLRERAGGAAHRLPVPAGQPAARLRDRHRRPLGAGARLVHLRRRRPDEPLRGQRRGAEDADPVPDPLVRRQRPVRRRDRRGARGDPRHRDLARAGAGRRRGEIQSTEAKIGPYELHDFFLHHIMRYGQRPSKVAFLAWHAWHDRERRRSGRSTSPRRRGAHTTCRRSPSGSRPSSGASSPSPSSSARRCRTGPKVSSGGALSPRGDWRAPSDATAAPWLDELRRSLPPGTTG